MAPRVTVVNAVLSDEVEALNAIYGTDTLQIVGAKGDNIRTRLALPTPGEVAFWITFPARYPDVPPKINGVDASLHQTFLRRVRNLTLVLFLHLNALYKPGYVCMFDVIETILPVVACLTDDGIDHPIASRLVPSFAEQEWRWAILEHIDMTTLDERTSCIICCDDDFNFKMVSVHCGHYFCFDCFQTGWDVATTDGDAYMCCLSRIPMTTIKQYANTTKEDEEKYTRLLIEKDTVNPFWCGLVDCGRLVGSLSEWELKRGKCRKSGILCVQCKRYTCVKCRMQKHGGVCSADPVFNDLMRTADVRRCPKCGSGIEKNGGCAHMRCTHCSSHWWWADDGVLSPFALARQSNYP